MAILVGGGNTEYIEVDGGEWGNTGCTGVVGVGSSATLAILWWWAGELGDTGYTEVVGWGVGITLAILKWGGRGWGIMD